MVGWLYCDCVCVASLWISYFRNDYCYVSAVKRIYYYMRARSFNNMFMYVQNALLSMCSNGPLVVVMVAVEVEVVLQVVVMVVVIVVVVGGAAAAAAAAAQLRGSSDRLPYQSKSN